MSTLTFKEKQKLEKLLGMASGHVLNFTDRRFLSHPPKKKRVEV
jgi:hypothetical protein